LISKISFNLPSAVIINGNIQFDRKAWFIAFIVSLFKLFSYIKAKQQLWVRLLFQNFSIRKLRMIKR